jgi:hypothetical protein
MKSRVALVIVLACAASMMPARARAFDETAAKERLGVRAGGLATFNGLSDAYGNGWALTLFFSEKLSRHLLIDVRLGALYLGPLKFTELDDKLTNQHGIESSMRLLYITLGPMIGRSIAGMWSVNASGGVGVYSVSMVFSNAQTPFDLSTQHWGFNGGLGLARRLNAKWSIEADGIAHYVLTTQDFSDVYYAFSDGAGRPIIAELTLGATLDLR